MRNIRLSPNLIAAGLFGVAYSTDASHNQVAAIVELAHFCWASLAEQGHDLNELLAARELDAEETAKAIARTRMIMDSIDSVVLGGPEALLSDTHAFSRAIDRLVGLQLSSIGQPQDLGIEDILMKAFETSASTH